MISSCVRPQTPLSSAPQWIHETYGFALAVFTFAIVFGAFSANVLFGAMRAVPMRNRKQHTHRYDIIAGVLAYHSATNVGLCASWTWEFMMV